MTRGQKREDKRQKTGDNEIEIFCRAHKILRAVFQLLLELKKKVFLFSLFVRPEFWILGSKNQKYIFRSNICVAKRQLICLSMWGAWNQLAFCGPEDFAFVVFG